LQEKDSTWAKGIGVHRAKELVEAAFFSFSISRKPQYDFREFIDEDVFRYSFGKRSRKTAFGIGRGSRSVTRTGP
jgi:hypothetical protein